MIALTFIVVFQGYHWFEHLVKMTQYFQDVPKPPGVLGRVFPLVDLHFWFNSVVSTGMVLAYWEFRPWQAFRRRTLAPAPELRRTTNT